MEILLTHDEIRFVVERPSELPASASADDYEMERYRRVAIEQAAKIMAGPKEPCPPTNKLCMNGPCGLADCRRCRREWLEREGK